MENLTLPINEEECIRTLSYIRNNRDALSNVDEMEKYLQDLELWYGLLNRLSNLIHAFRNNEKMSVDIRELIDKGFVK